MLDKVTDRPAVMHEFDEVELVTDKYADLGLEKGMDGTIMHVHTSPSRAYMVEFHDVPYENNDRVTTVEPNEIKLIKHGNYEQYNGTF